MQANVMQQQKIDSDRIRFTVMQRGHLQRAKPSHGSASWLAYAFRIQIAQGCRRQRQFSMWGIELSFATDRVIFEL